MNEKIKELHFGLENMESVIVPYECFKGLTINNNEELDLLKNHDTIYNMKCDITDNGKIEYGYSFENEIYPLTRLEIKEDICHVDIIYEDNTKIELTVRWGQWDCNNNSNQINSKINYNSIHIEIKPYIKQYTIQEVFEFEVGTIVEMIDNGIFIISEYEGNKCFKDVVFTKYLINGMYRIV